MNTEKDPKSPVSSVKSEKRSFPRRFPRFPRSISKTMRRFTGTIIIAVTIIITALIFTHAIKNRNRTNGTITVTGLGKTDFVSDMIVWSGSFTRKNKDLKAAYSNLNRDREMIKKYLLAKGVNEKDFVFSSISITRNQEEKFDKIGNRIYVFGGYSLTQRVQIESGEVDKIESVSREVTELIDTGVEFYSEAPQYYYTKLSELKVETVAQATEDARNRAKKVAEKAGCRLGKLQSALMDVFQIIAQNSSEEFSYGGTYNITSKRKTAIITVKLLYQIE